MNPPLAARASQNMATNHRVVFPFLQKAVSLDGPVGIQSRRFLWPRHLAEYPAEALCLSCPDCACLLLLCDRSHSNDEGIPAIATRPFTPMGRARETGAKARSRASAGRPDTMAVPHTSQRAELVAGLFVLKIKWWRATCSKAYNFVIVSDSEYLIKVGYSSLFSLSWELC